MPERPLYDYGQRPLEITPLKTADGLRVLKDQSSILETWAEHFNTLLNQDSDADHTILQQLPELPQIDHRNQPPTFHEVLSAVQSLKNNKSPGINNVPAELLKHGGYLCTGALHQYITKIWTNEYIPQQWRHQYCHHLQEQRPK